MDPIGLGIALADAKAVGIGIVIIITTTILFYVLKPDPEAPVEFTVPVPEQCKPGWKGKVLDQPSLKVISDPVFIFQSAS